LLLADGHFANRRVSIRAHQQLQVTMPVDHIRYDILVQQALRGMVRDVLAEAAKTKRLPGEHHFFITFLTGAEGVRLSDRLRAQYPEEMTIVLQHQFWDLKVGEDTLEVGLSFGGVPERLTVPFEAIKVFQDPSVQFTLQFETLAESPDESAEAKPSAPKIPSPKKRAPQRQEPARTSVPSSPRPAASGTAETPPDEPKPEPPDKGGGAEVVRLDRFRKK
jgi:hypothetical protein